MAQHPRQGQPDQRAGAVAIVLASAVVGIAEDRVAADDVEGQGLAGQPRRGGQGDGAGQGLGEPRGPGEHHVSAQRAADHRPQTPDAQVRRQPPLGLDDVAHGDHGEIAAVRAAGLGVDAVGAGRAAAAAEDVGTDHEVTVGVDGLARPDGDLPPARVVLVVVPRNVRIARQRVANEHGVVAPGVEPAVGLVDHGNLGKSSAPFQVHRTGEGDSLGVV